MTLSLFQPAAPPMPALEAMPPYEDRESVGLALRSARKAAGLTTARAAELGGVSVSQLGAIERGDHSLTSVSAGNLRRLPAAFGLSWGQFVELTAPVYGPYIPFLSDAQGAPPPQMPDTLREAVELYGGRFPDLLDPKWQRYLASIRFRNGSPTNPEKWLDVYRDLIRNDVVPGEN